MPTPCTNNPDEVISKVVSAKANADKFDKFVNGTNVESVQLGTGSPTPVIRNVVRQMLSAAAELDGADVSGKFSTAGNGGTELRSLNERFGDKINIKDFGAAGDGVTDDRDAFYEALKVFFNNPTKYKVLDLNGYNLGIGSNIKIRFGEGDFPVNQTLNVSKAAGLCICNGLITWLGNSSTNTYLIDIGTNASSDAQLVDFKFFNVRFNANGQKKNLVKIFNFYDLYFSQCTFSGFKNAVAVFLPSTRDDNSYCDDNGATFWDCRWYCKASEERTGTPILAYCGDIVVSRGFAEWCGPFDFHIGSILFDGFHWSYGGVANNVIRGAIFRDPREIQILGCDIDQCNFLFTTEGFAPDTTQVAATSWNEIIIQNNKLGSNVVPANSEGFFNFKVTNAGTSFYGFSVQGNSAAVTGHGDNAVPLVKVLDDGGSLSSIRGNYVYTDAWGVEPGDSDFGASTFSVSNASVGFFSDTNLDCGYIGIPAKTVLRGKRIVMPTGESVEDDGSSGITVKTMYADRWTFISAGHLRPAADNAYNLGSGGNRVATVYAASGSIDTSDEREKTNIREIDTSVLNAWGNVRFKVFQFINAVNLKGSSARLHVGAIAQDIDSAFKQEGLDATRYGLFCHDEWKDEYREVEVVDSEEVFDANGDLVSPKQIHKETVLEQEAGDRYGIRYEEALALECAYQRWLGEKRDARIAELEARLNEISVNGPVPSGASPNNPQQ